MPGPIPTFRYHPNPLATGSVREGPEKCGCCGQVRGYVYDGPIYSEDDPGYIICPWCIADGRAAKILAASFTDDWALVRGGLPEAVIDEVEHRTPGYSSWQSEQWLSHCGDACEFHGDATAEDLQSATAEIADELRADLGMSESQWIALIGRHEPGGDLAIYKFICRGCRTVLLGWDCS